MMPLPARAAWPSCGLQIPQARRAALRAVEGPAARGLPALIADRAQHRVEEGQGALHVVGSDGDVADAHAVLLIQAGSVAIAPNKSRTLTISVFARSLVRRQFPRRPPMDTREHFGDQTMEVVTHEKTYHAFSMLTRWAMLVIGDGIFFFTLWFATSAGFMGAAFIGLVTF